ncbi:hypothetical protein [Streptomyces sp. HO565]|uniref:hypothetical protein n=1 Tax=Streptomyces sp. HO565 TaxID=2857489 RepID=UPI0034DC5741
MGDALGSALVTIPQSCLDARAAAPGIALINSIANRGGFVATAAFGIINDRVRTRPAGKPPATAPETTPGAARTTHPGPATA